MKLKATFMADGMYVETFTPFKTTRICKDAMVVELDTSYIDADFEKYISSRIKDIFCKTMGIGKMPIIDIYLIEGSETDPNNFIGTIRLEMPNIFYDLDGPCKSKATPVINDFAKALCNYISSNFGDIVLSAKSALSSDIASIAAKAAKDAIDGTVSSGTAPTSEADLIDAIAADSGADITRPKEKLDDYICTAGLKEELLEIKDFMENKDTYDKAGVVLPRGILFKGAPGTGKTYAARCIAGNVDCYFMSCTASSLQGMYIGSGAANIKKLFKGAKALQANLHKGVIVFIDELDSLGSRDSHGNSSGGEEDRTLNQLLAEMSGFEDNDGILVMGATNYPQRLDDALLRSGRFSRQVTIPYPEDEERKFLTKYYFDKIKLPLKDVTTDEIANFTRGCTPADIKELSNESAILAIRQKLSNITLDVVNEAINKTLTKNIKNDSSKLDKHLIAAHECGHVLAEYTFNGTLPLKVTNVSYGDAGGFTQSGEHLEGILPKVRFLSEVKMLLGGRAAEEVMCTYVTNGASNDLMKAKSLIHDYYTVYNFEHYEVEKLSQIELDKLESLYKEVVEVFKEHKSELTKLIAELEHKRTLYTIDLASILGASIIGG